MKKRKKISLGDFILDFVIYTILIVLLVVTLYPMWYVIAASFSTSTDLLKDPGIFLWPKNFTAGAYKMVIENDLILTGFWNSIKIEIISLPVNIVLTLFCGYFMACTKMKWKRPIVYMIIFTMFFGGGMIPNYLNVVGLGLKNTVWSLVLPGALSVYNAIICKTAIEAIPESLSESAYIDGANDLVVLFKIITPLIKPTLAVLLLYYGVAHWNAWFGASIYIKDSFKMPIQNIMRQFLIANQVDASSGDNYNAYAETIKYATIVVSTVPILCVYPFVQKHFVKGVMIGAVKG